ncbi:hypothetical protein WN55_06779 [Dufourea novaeangliae]|uniref:Uncharacterized protein n=1 Tax=Dufourea novaeangliae TaxID=178035 RepID=A0A154PRI5_DUFNO|nr:hypothetical protein WN55_06779 [Dufourea novaeangliae]
MSENKVDREVVRKQYTNDAGLIDQVKIVDVSVFDFHDTDVWLYIPSQYSTETSIQNLYIWLKNEPELTLSGIRRSIDTRTFTRPKKRTSRTNFESILETLSPPLSNTWKSAYSEVPTANKEEIVPPMLKMAPNATATLLPDETMTTSGQESMEIFLNMSHSKGIDSFINLVEPGLGDPLMNVSQPSIFYSSITSLPRDDSLHNTGYDKEDGSSNSTHSISQQAAKHEDVENFNLNETFSMPHELDNKRSLSPTDKTFINKPDKMELNGTYKTEPFSRTLTLLCSDKDKHGTINLSSTIVNRDVEHTKLVQSEMDGKKESGALNFTYCATEIKEAVPAVIISITNDTRNDNSQACSAQKNATHILENLVESTFSVGNSSSSLMNDNALDSTFNVSIIPGNQSTPKTALNPIFQASSKHLEPSPIYNTGLTSTFKAPTSLRKELLAEIHRNADHRLDSTFNCVTNEFDVIKTEKDKVDEVSNQNVNDIPVQNKYNTYKKEPSVNRMKVRAEIANNVKACVRNSPEKKYYTFTKKGNAHNGKTDMENAGSVENVNVTFVKPLPKLQKGKQHIPRMLSKLPQFLQKSNPNLVSNSLRTVGVTGCTNASRIGYMKGSQPNIVRDVEKTIANKLYTIGKIKSGSEQRLLELNTAVGDLQMMGAGGSTESIESTQSAHSAPDLDDRLSTCSDSSHNSYTVQPLNIERLHQIVRMQEESLKQDSTASLSRRVLESTWTDMEKNFSSPILKNGTDGCESDSSSLTSMDLNVKTSSPIISPSRSSQSVNTDGHLMESAVKQQNETVVVKNAEAFNKPVLKAENKTRLRQPTNWNTGGNRTSNIMSAIPRPPSRIPAPRSARPTVKNAQGDVKRGYM